MFLGIFPTSSNCACVTDKVCYTDIPLFRSSVTYMYSLLYEMNNNIRHRHSGGQYTCMFVGALLSFGTDFYHVLYSHFVWRKMVVIHIGLGANHGEGLSISSTKPWLECLCFAIVTNENAHQCC